MTDPARIVHQARTSGDLSVRALAEAAAVAPSTVHRIERGRLAPTVDMIGRLLEATGLRLDISARPDPATLAGVARAIYEDLERDPDDRTTPVRRAAEFNARFERTVGPARHHLLSTAPPSTGYRRWDAFVAALAEWLSVRHQLAAPSWVHEPKRYQDPAWWVTTMPSMRAWEYAGSPASFQRHGIYIHRDSLRNV